MIEYSKFASDNKFRIRDLTWMHARIFAVLSIIAIVLGANFFLAGIAANSEPALKLSFQILTIAAVSLAIYVILHNKIKKAVLSNFDEFEMDGKIDFTIENVDDGTVVFTRLTDEESFTIRKEDIKKIKRMKYNNIIVLKDKRTIDIPKRVNINDLNLLK